MKILVTGLNILLIIAFCTDLFIWLTAYASGHTIPSKTYWSFFLSSLFLILAIVLLNFWGRKKKN